MAVLCIQLDYVVVSGQFFFCLVCDLLEKKRKGKAKALFTVKQQKVMLVDP